MSLASSPIGNGMVRGKLRVKTGCLTCRIRKIKCDEIKPACNRCISTGRKCDGYASQPAKVQLDRTVSRQHSTRSDTANSKLLVRPMSDVCFISHSLSAEERYWIDVFRIRTGPVLSNVCSPSFWAYTLPQLSVEQPAIRHAMLALGSAQTRLEAGATGDSLTISPQGAKFDLCHYNQALKHLQLYMKEQKTTTEIPLICCLLFVSLECLHGNQTLFMSHLRYGLNILSQTVDKPQSGDYHRSIKQEIRTIFRSLHTQSSLSAQEMIDLDSSMPSTMPTTFGGLEEAKAHLDSLISSTLIFERKLANGGFADSAYSRLAEGLQSHLEQQYKTWEVAITRLLDAYGPMNEDEIRREKSLRVQHLATEIWLSRCRNLHECHFDACHDKFASVVEWSRDLLIPNDQSSEDTKHSSPPTKGPVRFTVNVAIIPAVYLTAIKCRDPILRRKAVDILRTTTIREGLWDPKVYAKVARRVIEIEEVGALMSAGAKLAYLEAEPSMRVIADGEPTVLTTLPAEHARVRDVQIADGDVLTSGKCDVIFVTAPNGLLEDWQSWTETFRFKHRSVHE